MSAPIVFVTEPLDQFMEALQPLTEAGHAVRLGPAHSRPTERVAAAELIESGASALIGMAREQITREVIEHSPSLRVICKFGTGVDNIDIDAATAAGVLVTNTPVHSSTVAEYAFALLLACLRRIVPNVEHLRNGGWRAPETEGIELLGRTVGIIGFGGIGREFFQRLRGWGVDVLVFDPGLPEDATMPEGARRCGLDELLGAADVVSLHVPLLPATRHLIGRRELGLMKRTAILINSARGPIVDEAALTGALLDGSIAGAGLDVFEQEPPGVDNVLLRLDNVVATPHVAGSTADSLRRIVETAVRSAVTALSGEVPPFVVNPEAIQRWRHRGAQ